MCSAAWRHPLPKEATKVDRDPQPSGSLHLSPHPETHPHPTAVPRLGCTSCCHSGSFWQDVQLSLFHPSCLCLSPSPARRDDSRRPNPLCPRRGTAQTRVGSAACHRSGPQAGSLPASTNQDSSFWQKLPASDPDFILGFLIAGCKVGPCSGRVLGRTARLPYAITVCLLGIAPTAAAPRGLKLKALKALSLGLLIESGFPKALYFWEPQNNAKIPAFF